MQQNDRLTVADLPVSDHLQRPAKGSSSTSMASSSTPPPLVVRCCVAVLGDKEMHYLGDAPGDINSSNSFLTSPTS